MQQSYREASDKKLASVNTAVAAH